MMNEVMNEVMTNDVVNESTEVAVVPTADTEVVDATSTNEAKGSNPAGLILGGLAGAGALAATIFGTVKLVKHIGKKLKKKEPAEEEIPDYDFEDEDSVVTVEVVSDKERTRSDADEILNSMDEVQKEALYTKLRDEFEKNKEEEVA